MCRIRCGCSLGIPAVLESRSVRDRKPSAPMGWPSMQRKKVSASCPLVRQPVVLVVVEQSPLAGGPESDNAFLVPLSQNLDVPVVQVGILVFQGNDLGEPEAGIQHEGVDGSVPGSQDGVGIDAGKGPLNLLVRENLDLQLRAAWAASPSQAGGTRCNPSRTAS